MLCLLRNFLLFRSFPEINSLLLKTIFCPRARGIHLGNKNVPRTSWLRSSTFPSSGSACQSWRTSCAARFRSNNRPAVQSGSEIASPNLKHWIETRVNSPPHFSLVQAFAAAASRATTPRRRLVNFCFPSSLQFVFSARLVRMCACRDCARFPVVPCNLWKMI